MFNCILAGASGTHFVCVCIIHKNVKLTYYPGVDDLKASLTSLLGDKLIESIVYKLYTSVERSTLETISHADEFPESYSSNTLIHCQAANSETNSTRVFCKFQQISLRTMHLFSKMKLKDSTGIMLKLQCTLL